MLINVKMPMIFGILTFMSRISFMLSWVEYEKSFITSSSEEITLFVLCTVFLFQYVLNPTFRSKHIENLDRNPKLSRAYDGTTYLPGTSSSCSWHHGRRQICHTLFSQQNNTYNFKPYSLLIIFGRRHFQFFMGLFVWKTNKVWYFLWLTWNIKL